MSVCRITTLTMKSKESADAQVDSYTSTASSKFPEAEQLLQIRADDTTVIAISLYENQEAMERASATRSQSIDSAQDNIVSVDTKVGTVELNYSRR